MRCAPAHTVHLVGHVTVRRRRFYDWSSILLAGLIVVSPAAGQTTDVSVADPTDPEVQYELAKECLEGDITEKNVDEALRWLHMATDQNFAPAQNYLGVLYQLGEVVPRDIDEALYWYRLAADQGDAKAQANLGFLYSAGDGVDEDPTEAVRWIRLAADQGEPRAQFELALFHAMAYGVPQDFEEAHRWVELSAEQNFPPAQSMLGMMYELGDGVPQDFSEAARWYAKAAEHGDVIAQVNLGAFHELGKGVDQDLEEAERLYRMAAEQGDIQAYANLCRFIGLSRPSNVELDDDGTLRIETPVEGLPMPDPELIGWCRTAAEQGDAEAQFRMGMFYAMGRLIPNLDSAAYWYTLAAEQGHAEAQLRLGAAYSMGLGVRADLVQAYVYFRLSAENDNPEAQKEVELLEQMLKPKQIKKAERRLAEWRGETDRP